MPAFVQRTILRVFIVWGVCCGSSLQATAADNVAEAKTRLLNNVKQLADDTFEGRGVGSKGIDLAAELIERQFREAGLDTTVVAGGARQTFELVTSSELGPKNSLKFVGPEGKTIDLVPNENFQVCSFGGAGTFNAPIAFCGYGIEDPETNYNDYADIDVKGKVVLVIRRNPAQSDPHGPFASAHGISRHAELRTKVSQAVQHGAVGVLIVNDPYSVRKASTDRQESAERAREEIAPLAEEFLAATGDADKVAAARQKLEEAVQKWKSLRESTESSGGDTLMKFGYAGNNENQSTPPVFHISISQGDALLQAALGKTVADLEAAIDAELKPHSQVLPGWTVEGSADIQQVRSNVSNIIGVLEGSGPLAEETIVVGAHYDHVGMGGPNSLAPGSKDVHNGADDNASGTSALLELARRLGSRTQKLPRRVMFIAFTGEELGLLGSARYVKEPVIPLDQTIAMFNMDMVGRMTDDKLTIFGSGTSPRWEPELNALNKDAGFQLTFKPEGIGPSDHSSFYGKKIPVLHLFTGSHPDYHRPTDDWDKINVDGMYRVVDLLEQMIVQTAENPERPEYVEVKQAPMAQRGGNRPYFGTIPDFGSEGEGYAISGAAPGSPAAKAGMIAGDSIIDLGGNKITGLDDFDLALRKFKAGQEIDVTVLRKNEPVKLKVTLDPPR